MDTKTLFGVLLVAGIVGGFSINNIQDIDAMLMFEYKKFYPTFYTNLFWASRNTNQVFEYYTVDSLLVENISIDNDVDYHLFSADLGTRFSKFDFKFWLNYNYVNYNQKIFKYIVKPDGIKSRYIKLKASNIGQCPEYHPGAGGKAWIFTDEIIII